MKLSTAEQTENGTKIELETSDRYFLRNRGAKQMRVTLSGLLVFIAGLLLATTQVYAQKDRKPIKEKQSINIQKPLTGEKIRGPVIIDLNHANRIRYQLSVGSTITFSAGPSLALPFIPTVPK